MSIDSTGRVERRRDRFRPVASCVSITEGDPGVESEKGSQNALGQPGPAVAQSYGGRGSATRRARRLDVQFDVADLWLRYRKPVHNRDHNSRSEQQNSGQHTCGGLGKPYLNQRSFFTGTTRAMVGAYKCYRKVKLSGPLGLALDELLLSCS